MRRRHQVWHPEALSWDGSSPRCGGACVVRDVRNDGVAVCVEPDAVVRARAGSRGWVSCVRACVGGCGGGALGALSRPTLAWGTDETQEGAAVNPFLPDLKLVGSRRCARGLPRRLGAVPARRGTPRSN